MVIGSRFPAEKVVTAHVEAIKFGLAHDIVAPEHIVFYGNENKATLVTALCDGTVVARKERLRRRGN